MPTDLCLTCGHDRDQHPPDHFAMFGWHCKVVGCSCGQFERTGPATASTPTGAVAGPPLGNTGPPPVVFRPAGVLHSDFYEDDEPVEKIVAAFEAGEKGITGPSDLAHAIQAATDAMRELSTWPREQCEFAARTATVAAAPVLLQATRDRLADLQGECTSLRIRLGELGVSTAELHLTLTELWDDLGKRQGRRYVTEHVLHTRVTTALQTDPPARGRAILEEVERLREFVRDIRSAMTPEAVAAAYAALDLGAAQEEDIG